MIAESTLEKRLVKGVRELDCFIRKIQFISHRGCPDRLIITPQGTLFWVEMKKKGGRLSTAQKREILTLKRHQQKVEVLSSVHEVDNFLEELKCYLN
ncbi:MAG: nuclease [Candidatus Liberibacter europaeus]|uniref:Nuclease n=1 Tax=Candidatus Liberibacter europaeus TaxID=744859 RepID=A0A2T4VWP5_9HYPH|nr:nuclease [Candidatus Liberibacter europaeus]MBY7649800.1 nuclease [Candidatus Liberibacter europaeus]PTL86203.1 MAG: nuclease [Candidatus Liberibacter europaeus]PTL86446.1 MAG: nuclease [Candidatus Liberibacter europaeus]